MAEHQEIAFTLHGWWPRPVDPHDVEMVTHRIMAVQVDTNDEGVIAVALAEILARIIADNSSLSVAYDLLYTLMPLMQMEIEWRYALSAAVPPDESPDARKEERADAVSLDFRPQVADEALAHLIAQRIADDRD